jgi:hypothetical protein
VTELAAVRGRLGHRVRLVLEVTGSTRPFHLRNDVAEVAPEVLRRVVEMVHRSGGCVLDCERHHCGRRRGAIFEDRVLEVVIVLQPKVIGVHRGRAAGEIDGDVVVAEDRRPEKPVLSNTRVEVGDLSAPQTGVEDVNSNKCKRRPADVSVAAAERTLHESHVIEEERQRASLPGFAVVPFA